MNIILFTYGSYWFFTIRMLSIAVAFTLAVIFIFNHAETEVQKQNNQTPSAYN